MGYGMSLCAKVKKKDWEKRRSVFQTSKRVENVKLHTKRF